MKPTTIIAAMVVAIAAPAAAQPLDPPSDRDAVGAGQEHQERAKPERPHYLPSWERTQRNYLPSYQYELERRKLCGSYCDDFTRRYPR